MNTSVDLGYSNMYQYVIDDQYSDVTYTTGIAQVAHTLTHATEPLYDGGDNRANIIGSLVALGRNYVNATNYGGSYLILVQTAVSGTTVEQWLAGLLSRSLSASTSANLVVNNTATVTMFTFVQGESDAEIGTSGSSFLTQVLAITNISRNSTQGAHPTTPFIYGSMVPEWVLTGGYTASATTIQNVLRAIPQTIPYTAYVNHPLGYVDCVESIHYSATGQRMMGAMMMQAYWRAVNNSNPSLVPSHPTGLSVTGDSLQWTAPSSSPVTGYVILYAPYTNLNNPGGSCLDGSSTPPSQIWTNSTATTFTFPSPLYGFYQFDVSASNGIQISSGSASSWVIVNLLPPSSSSTAALSPSSPTVVQWFASGGATYTDTFGALWTYTLVSIADEYLETYSVNISNTANPALYQVDAYGVAEGDPVTLVFNVNPLFSYSVMLMFADNFCTYVGCRVFNVTINGILCISNFDIYLNAGYATAFNVLCAQTVTSASSVTVALVDVVASPQINALQILPLGMTNNYTQSVLLSPTVVQWFASGGPTYTDTFGALWTYNATSISGGNLESNLTNTISNTINPALYHVDAVANTFAVGSPITLIFSVTPVFSYSVMLMFSDNYCTFVGCRVFNVTINSILCVSNLDIYQSAGTATAYNILCPSTVSGSGAINVTTINIIASAQINALQILPIGVVNNYTQGV